MSVTSTLVGQAAQERIQRLATQYQEEYPKHPQKAKFDQLLNEYQTTQTHKIPDYKIHELFDQFFANPDIATFVPKAPTISSRIRDLVTRFTTK